MAEPHSNCPAPATSSEAMPKTSEEVRVSGRPQLQDGYQQLTDTDAVYSLTRDQRITLVSLTASLGEQEADRLWKRYGIMLTLNGGLLAIASFCLSNSLEGFTAAITGLGLVLTFFWYRIVSLSQYYEERWRRDLSAIIDCDDVLATLLRARSHLGSRSKRPFSGSATGYAKATVFTIGLFWIALTLYFGFFVQSTSFMSQSPSAPASDAAGPSEAGKDK